jgi:dephospho-CoA kinase
MLWIGLSGGIASGKSTVGQLLQELGYPVINADSVARQVVRPGSDLQQRVVALFGQHVLTPEGELDRAALGREVFSEVTKRKQLEDLLHPEIQKWVAQERAALEKQGHPAAFYDVPLLFEKQLQGQFDATILVDCEREQQVERLKRRNPELSLQEVEQRLSVQIPIEDKRNMADYLIDNRKGLIELKSQVKRVVANMFEKFTKTKNNP